MAVQPYPLACRNIWGYFLGMLLLGKTGTPTMAPFKHCRKKSKTGSKGTHFAAMAKREEIGPLLSMIDNYKGTVVRISYLKLSL